MKRLIFLMIISTSMMFAQPRWGEDPPTFQWKGICEKLNLSEDQQKQFDKMQSDMQKKQIDLRSKIQSLHIDIKDIFKDDDPDKGKIESKLNEITKLQTEIRKNHLDFWFGVYKILKPDQRKVWKEHRIMFGDGIGQRGGLGMKGEFGHRMYKRGGRGMGMINYPPGCWK